MRWLPWVLLALLALLQYRLWMGDGSLAEVWNLYQQVETQKRENRELRDRNQALEAEVVDLKQGLDAIEERAREELGMIREDETFYQIVEEPEREESARP
jgi:cell division protein FtsB